MAGSCRLPARHLADVARHLTHQAARIVRFFIGIASAAFVGIFSVGQHQYRALQQFFKWLAAEDELPDPMAGLQPPPVTEKLVPVFTGEELARLEQACTDRSFAQRRDTAIIEVFKATGMPGWPSWPVSGTTLVTRGAATSTCGSGRSPSAAKGGKDRIVRIGHQSAQSLDRYLRTRSRHAQAWRPKLWLGAGNREPLTAAGIYQMTARHGPATRRGRLPAPVPAPLQPHPVWTAAGPRETWWNSTAGPPRRCSAATAPAPAAPEPAAPTTAS
jgi:site-specific recombinase XerD